MNKLLNYLTLFFVLFFISCEEEGRNVLSSLTEEPQEEIEQSADGNEKLNLLIEVYNSFSSDTYKDYDRYVETFGDDADKYVQIKDWYNGENYSEYTIKKIDALDDAIALNIYNELNPLIEEYKTSALALNAVVSKMYNYFDMKDYEVDDFKNAKNAHKETLSAYNAFLDIDDYLRTKSDSIQVILELEYLEQLKKDGQTLDYLVGVSLNAASQMLNICQEVPYEELNPTDLEKNHEIIRNYYDEMAQYKADNPGQFTFSSKPNYDGYLGAFRDFVKASNELTNRKKNNTPYSTGEKMNLNPSAGWMVNGSTFKLLKKYNDLVDKYNRLIN